MARARRSRSQRGFTLTELMVVVAIIAILATFVISASGRPVGANARNVSEQLVSMVSYAKLRASSTRKIHRIRIRPTDVSIWEASTTGLVPKTTPVVTNFNELVQNKRIPAGVKIWHVETSPITGIGTSVTENTSLEYFLDVRPDGQATASTIFVTDGKEPWRVLVYRTTGGAYARPQW